MARPLKQIDEKLLAGLARIGCTVEEMASILDCSKDTLERRFAALIEKGRSEMKMSLRRQQIRLMENGNATMAIWLGKQYLGQADRQELTGAGGQAIAVKDVTEHSNEERANRILELVKPGKAARA